MKECSKCHIKKKFSDFCKDKSRKDGRHCYCKQCTKSMHKDRWDANKEYKEKITKRNAEYRNSNRGKNIREAWENSKEGQFSIKKYRQSKGKKLYQKEYFKTEAGKLAIKKSRDKQKNNIQHVLSSNVSRSIRYRISNKNCKKSFGDILPYTIKNLINHLEKQFKKGMSWENYGYDGWTIDHKIPQSKFNFNSHYDKDFKKCWALENLQPLWSKDNGSKGNKDWQEWLEEDVKRKEYYATSK